MPTITFNGKTYNSLEEIPEQERQAYQQLTDMFVDKNGNGIPDFLEGDIVKNISNIYTAASTIRFDGNMYNNLNELPPDVQAKVKTAFNQIAGMGWAQANVAETNTNSNVQNEAYGQPTKFVSREYNPVIQEEGGSNFKTWLLIGVAVLACFGAIAVAVLFFMFL